MFESGHHKKGGERARERASERARERKRERTGEGGGGPVQDLGREAQADSVYRFRWRDTEAKSPGREVAPAPRVPFACPWPRKTVYAGKGRREVGMGLGIKFWGSSDRWAGAAHPPQHPPQNCRLHYSQIQMDPQHAITYNNANTNKRVI